MGVHLGDQTGRYRDGSVYKRDRCGSIGFKRGRKERRSPSCKNRRCAHLGRGRHYGCRKRNRYGKRSVELNGGSRMAFGGACCTHCGDRGCQYGVAKDARGVARGYRPAGAVQTELGGAGGCVCQRRQVFEGASERRRSRERVGKTPGRSCRSKTCRGEFQKAGMRSVFPGCQPFTVSLPPFPLRI